MKKSDESLHDLWRKNKEPICSVEFQEKREERGQTAYFKNEKISNLQRDLDIQNHEAQG